MSEFFGYGLPAMLGAILTSDYLFGRYRWTLISELYEMLQALFSLQAIMMVIRNPRAPSFHVTPKGEHMEEDTISHLAGPFYVVYALVVVTMLVGVWRIFHADGHLDVILSAMGWNLLNLIILNACIGVLYERRQRRATPRVPTNMSGYVTSPEGARLDCQVIDISSGGAQLQFDAALAEQVVKSLDRLHVFNRALDHDSAVPIMVRNVFPAPDKRFVVAGVKFSDQSVAGLSETVSLSSGDSQRWTEYRAHRNRTRGIAKSVWLLITLGTVHAGGQYALFFKGFGMYLKRRVIIPVSSSRFIASFPYKMKRIYEFLIS